MILTLPTLLHVGSGDAWCHIVLVAMGPEQVRVSGLGFCSGWSCSNAEPTHAQCVFATFGLWGSGYREWLHEGSKGQDCSACEGWRKEYTNSVWASRGMKSSRNMSSGCGKNMGCSRRKRYLLLSTHVLLPTDVLLQRGTAGTAWGKMVREVMQS